MALVRTVDSLESHDFLERRNDPADRRARCLYLLPNGKLLVDEVWRLVDLTRREAFAGIPRKQADLVIESLEKIQSNLASLQPLPVPAEAAPSSGRRGAVRSRRARTALQA
jgi:MarR family transcriptional regulator for hemolysin